MNREEQYKNISDYIKSIDIFTYDIVKILEDLKEYNDDTQEDLSEKEPYSTSSRCDVIRLKHDDPNCIYDFNIGLVDIYKIYHKNIFPNILLKEYLSNKLSFKENAIMLGVLSIKLNHQSISDIMPKIVMDKYYQWMWIPISINSKFYKKLNLHIDGVVHIDTDNIYTKSLDNIIPLYEEYGYEYVIEKTNVFILKEKMLFEYDDNLIINKHIRNKNYIDRFYTGSYDQLFRELKFRKLLN